MSDHSEEKDYQPFEFSVVSSKDDMQEYRKYLDKMLDLYFESVGQGEVFIIVEAGKPTDPPPGNGD